MQELHVKLKCLPQIFRVGSLNSEQQSRVKKPLVKLNLLINPLAALLCVCWARKCSSISSDFEGCCEAAKCQEC